ncbi:MAG TPA: M23 family metallopeptidase, partial [Lachnospiraceae bacterium]|nr:M23 family metallopeptidase [Lachnospiraceae bacterium]
YYAHLHSYAPEIEIGDEVKAGDLLGFMGDTGYSKVEGTTGNFDVHLHFGIYYDEAGEEKSVNPYWVLRYLEDYKLQFNYE